mmetsp:Transcript_7473/g.10122  ORF Transcript_7473/g.10122 Transcript_7473/m.10122 type:complete len:241 (-) Transcript_7473:400-1122(-)|eukprot:CAMPEP_0196576898 /NCGR_PEP_ID=MMETSP1081-20130531/6050_1 /TAXON_ID=36882 /ORGANISM="Pyramimonas amylifera, Strain CCMP720" /LENGTH=240 /DNA_ID=CAMNT_0041895631 /DNA_START=65 /DNA_END=787 /DNA_ORIENTATION=+
MASLAAISTPACTSASQYHARSSNNRVGGVKLAFCSQATNLSSSKAHFGGSQIQGNVLSMSTPRKSIVTEARRGGPREPEDGFEERVVQVRRVTKVVKGGKQLSFRAVVIVGDGEGKVGVGCAKAKEVINAVQKAAVTAKKEAVTVKLANRARTITHRTNAVAGGAVVMLRPASEGTGVIAGGAVRVVLELAGIKNCFGKQLGSNNPLNNARATVAGLQSIRSFNEVAEMRGLSIEELFA